MILLRHGESEFNASFNRTRIDPGIRDPQLTERGREQAAAAAERLRGHGLKRLIASPYRRALETATIVAHALDLQLTVEPLVRERAFFICDIGTMRSQLQQAWPGLSFSHLDEKWWPDREEHESELLRRCTRFRELMAQATDWPEVAVVSHWAFIRGLTGIEASNGQAVRFDPLRGEAAAAWDPPARGAKRAIE